MSLMKEALAEAERASLIDLIVGFLPFDVVLFTSIAPASTGHIVGPVVPYSRSAKYAAVMVSFF